MFATPDLGDGGAVRLKESVVPDRFAIEKTPLYGGLSQV